MAMNTTMAVFCIVAPCIWNKFISVSEILAAFIIRAMTYLLDDKGSKDFGNVGTLLLDT
jgi:hypothetical protein